LEIQEWNFREIFQKYLNTILDWQKVYWKQRGSIKWVTSGDACIIFFHDNATIRHRQNLIATLQDENGNEIQGHE
jgi:predicted oxidoreductase (fatty acid repression mutant protein)